MLNCNGQCYLSKKLKASQDKQEQESTASFMLNLINLEATTTSSKLNLTLCFTLFEPEATHNFYYLPFGLAKNFSKVFHPPQA